MDAFLAIPEFATAALDGELWTTIRDYTSQNGWMSLPNAIGGMFLGIGQNLKDVVYEDDPNEGVRAYNRSKAIVETAFTAVGGL